MSINRLGSIQIQNIIDNNDGTCTLIFNVEDELKEKLMQNFGWKKWSSKKFEKFFLEALHEEANKLERNVDNSNAINNGGATMQHTE